jgi:predicted transcriptional regulator
MYKTNINCPTIKKFLQSLSAHELIEERFVEHRKNKNVFAITDKGKTVIKQYLKIDAFFQDVKKPTSTCIYKEYC